MTVNIEIPFLDDNELPFISIVMPIRNEMSYIKRSLGAVLNADYPKNKIEIVIADGMSTDDTRSICTTLLAGRENTRIIDNPDKIVSTGLNKAIMDSTGEIIIRVDGHCVISKDYFTKCVHYLLTQPVMGVGGPMKTIGETRIAETIALAMSSKFGVGGSAFRTIKNKTMFVDTIPFPAYWRKDILKIGLFDEELVRNQDDEYNFRIREKGGKLLMAADIKSTYYSRASLKKLWKQYYQYGFYKVRVMQKHWKQMHLRHFIPSVFVLSLFFSLLLGLFWKPGWVLFTGLGGSYILVNLIASFQLSYQAGWSHLYLLPVVFFILHISYGMGMLAGLFKFRKFWEKMYQSKRVEK
ncbi:MAG: succinoglycan biosynthesis protein exoa [Anaerolineaceae bacterium]|nr:succinoglycan biosynthesis protein exoa [Anaerolineaceae bacterium]